MKVTFNKWSRSLMSRFAAALLLGLAITGCGDKDGHDDTGHVHDDSGATDDSGVETSGYAFQSAFEEGSSVSYSGQVFRNVLIGDMKGRLDGVTARIDNGDIYPVEGDIAGELLFYFEFDSSTSGQVSLGMSEETATLQQTYDDVSSDKDIVSKLAGNDATGQHADWTTDFVGWPAEGVTTPESLVRLWIDQIDAASVARSSGEIPLDPMGAPVSAVYITPEGHDLQQLIEKLLRGAVAFSQGADDYLDDDIEGKGLLSDHTGPVEGKPYTALEHGWDEGFGYFGAAVTYGDWTDDEIADSAATDVDGDGVIDLLSEVNYGHSVNAAKRDRGAPVTTDMTAEAWAGFYEGRLLLSQTAGVGLSDAELVELQGHRDRAVAAWEAAISSTVVHYINDTLQDMNAFGSEDYDFSGHAKHWSELKGFALSMQFNPRSPLSDAQFAELHALIGAAPVLPTAEQAAQDDYRQALLDARALIGEAYGFDPANLGDDNGENGW